MSNGMRQAVFALLGLLLAAPCAFFGYYTARLLYINLTVPSVASHRQTGMYIGAVAFPLATLVFGWLSLQCLKKSRNPS
jgi:hypothetical protein